MNNLARLVVGLGMMMAGVYWFLKSVYVHQGFGFRHNNMFYDYNSPFYGSGMSSVTGWVVLPLLLGIGMLFYNPKSAWGWLIAASSMVILVISTVTSVNFSFRSMSAFDFLTMIVLIFGGAGLFLSASRKG